MLTTQLQRRFHETSRKKATLLSTFDLCLDCTRSCKRAGPPWCRIECPLCLGTGCKHNDYRVVNMSDEELVSRVAFG